jgi:hypothetical protein
MITGSDPNLEVLFRHHFANCYKELSGYEIGLRNQIKFENQINFARVKKEILIR